MSSANIHCIKPGHAFTKYLLYQTWPPVSVPEMRNILDLIFITEIINKSTLKTHSTEEPDLGITVFVKTMTQNRLKDISFLHCNDGSMYKESTDTFHAICPILKMFHEKFSALQNPQTQIELEQGILGWRGSL
jgi:hypothetical protein